MSNGFYQVIDCYIRLIVQNKMKLEDVPERYRAVVEATLNGKSDNDEH